MPSKIVFASGHDVLLVDEAAVVAEALDKAPHCWFLGLAGYRGGECVAGDKLRVSAAHVAYIADVKGP
jgi:hypothetical protein